MSIAPLGGPVVLLAVLPIIAAVVGGKVQVVPSGGVITLNVGKIEENLAVVPAVFAYAFVQDMECASAAAAVQMACHINECDARIGGFQRGHGIQIGINAVSRVI